MKFAIVIGTLLFIPAALVSVMLAGGGHGSYLAAKVLFPYTVLIAAYVPAINFLGIAAACAQFPICVWSIGRLKTLGWIGVAGCHVTAAAVVIALKPDAFTP